MRIRLDMTTHYNVKWLIINNWLDTEVTVLDELLTTKEIASLPVCPVKAHTLAVWRSRGRGPKYIKRNGRVYYRRVDFEAWINEGETEPSE